MRITFVVPVLDLSGGARIIAGHARKLMERGHDVLILAPGLNSKTLKERALDFFATRGAGEPSPSINSHYALAKLPIRRGAKPGPPTTEDFPDADLVVATWWETAEWIWPLPAMKGTKVHFIQGYEAFPEIPADRVDAVWRLPLRKIAVAQWLVDLGRERFAIDQIDLVPNSIDHALFRPNLRDKNEVPRVGFIFHRTRIKDLPTLLGSLKRLKENEPLIRFVCFGGVKPSRSELPQDTTFHYRPSQEKIAEVYGSCDAWLSPNPVEGFNLPPIEAMASGCPVVCAKTGRPLEIVKNGVNGYLVERGDVEGFSQALRKIVTLPNDQWRKMSEAAIASTVRPSWEESSDLFEAALVDASNEALL